jgi:glycosyltransferase involved in cell wall biosynthesis
MKLRNVRIIDRILGREEVAKLTGEADALLLPLKDFGRPYLGISSKLYEYQAVGKPIICCANGQLAEYVKETSSGIVVKPGDHKALANAILYLKENNELAEKLGASGRQNVEQKLSVEKIGQEMMNVLQHLTEKLRI